MQVSFYTLGCKVNQNETDALMQLFIDAGFGVVNQDDDADIFIVNSCTVTEGADKKSRQWLRRAKRENPEAITVLTGCFPQAFPELAPSIPEADIITGSHARKHLLDDVLAFMQHGQRIVDITEHKREDKFEELPLNNIQGHTRAFLKIEDGCNRRCSYCIIPKARGRVRSRTQENILNELKVLASKGFKEAVFSGINLSSYGKDTNTNLAEIVEEAAKIDGIERIRLGSLEPDLMDDEMLLRLSKVDKLCCQFHLALQSGCDKTLAGMGRIYRTNDFRILVNKMREMFPSCSFTTDIIVGFPDETDEDFAQSVAFMEEMKFLKVHVFPYSKRSGTRAAEMPNQIDQSVKNKRNKEMQKASDIVREKIIKKEENSIVSVLLEKSINAYTFTGYTKEYIPILIEAKGHKSGDIVNARLNEFDGERCKATIIEEM